MNLARAALEIEGHTLRAWVARSREERALGLMHCRNLADDEGMLFMCTEPAIQSFWMKDTPLPLSIAFLADDGTILHIEDMEPHSQESHHCETPVRFVLEVGQGWFDTRAVAAGARVAGPMFGLPR